VDIFAAPLVPTQCYFSATIKQSEVEAQGVIVWASEADCSCIPAPPPPASPPSRIYFCGLPAVWHFFDHPLIATTCYYSYSLTRIDVMSQGVDVYHDAVGCRCVLPPPPIPSTLPPPFALVSLRSPPKAPSPSAPTPLSSISKAAHIGSMVQLAETKMHNNWPEPSPVMERQAPRTFFALGAEKLLSLSERVPVSPARRPGITDLINHPSQATLQVPTVFAVLVGCGLMTLLLRRYAIIDETSCPESDTIHIHSVEDRRKVDLL